MSSNDNSMPDEKVRMRNSKWFFVIPFAAIALHYIISNLLYVAAGRALLNGLHLPEAKVMEFSDLIETLIYIILIVMFFVIYKLAAGKEGSERRTALNAKDAWLSIVSGIGTAGVICLWIAVLEQIPALKKSVETVTAGAGEGNLIGTIVVSAICAPIMEEILFRGIVFKSLKKVIPVWAAVVLSSVMFGAYHMNIVQAVYASCMGLVAAIIYEKKNNLIFPIIVHITNNFLAAVQQFMPERANNIVDIAAIAMIPALVYVMYRLLKNDRLLKKSAEFCKNIQ